MVQRGPLLNQRWTIADQEVDQNLDLSLEHRLDHGEAL